MTIVRACGSIRIAGAVGSGYCQAQMLKGPNQGMARPRAGTRLRDSQAESRDPIEGLPGRELGSNRGMAKPRAGIQLCDLLVQVLEVISGDSLCLS